MCTAVFLFQVLRSIVLWYFAHFAASKQLFFTVANVLSVNIVLIVFGSFNVSVLLCF